VILFLFVPVSILIINVILKQTAMKKLIFYVLLIAGLESASAQEINIDSLVYADTDTTGLAKSIAADEAAWSWTDTLFDGNYKAVDSYVLGITKKYKNIPDLAKDINLNFSSDADKIRAIFIWMVANIAYDYVELAKKDRKIKGLSYAKGTPKVIIAQKWENVYFDYATKVLRNKRGICEGYATLFYELCTYTNINCKMITGFADEDEAKIEKYRKLKYVSTNHAWNKVLLNGEWLYIDVTWASSGKYDLKRKTTKGKTYSPFYYLVKENNLYPDHIVNEKQSKRRNDIIGNYKD
jgi:Transglutaminase-like superfamily